jgi:hypothetical protein
MNKIDKFLHDVEFIHFARSDKSDSQWLTNVFNLKFPDFADYAKLEYYYSADYGRFKLKIVFESEEYESMFYLKYS